jgi:hypothetical protein
MYSREQQRALLELLIEFCYPGSGYLALCDPDDMAAYPHLDVMRTAVADVLTRYVQRRIQKFSSVRIIQDAYNETVKLSPTLDFGTPSLRGSVGIMWTSPGRNAVTCLLQYLSNNDPSDAAICAVCGHVFVRTKPNQNYCTQKCRWRYWNQQKMEGYYARKAKAAREYQRLKKARRKK